MTRALVALTAALALAAGCEIPDRTIEVDPDAGIELQEILVDPVTLDIPEGSTASFDVTLRYDPRSTVTAAIATRGGSPLSVAPTVLTFTSADYAAPHTVTVSAPVDSNTTSETGTITVSVAGAARAGIMTVRSVDGTQLDTWGWPPEPPFPSTILAAAEIAVAYRIDVGAVGDVDTFHTYVPMAVGSFRMALYTDEGDLPGTLVAEMAARKRLVDGANDGPIVNGPRLDQPTYFLVVRFSENVNIAYASAGPTGRQCIRDFRIPPRISGISDPWPTRFEASTCATAPVIQIWLTTRRLPEVRGWGTSGRRPTRVTASDARGRTP